MSHKVDLFISHHSSGGRYYRVFRPYSEHVLYSHLVVLAPNETWAISQQDVIDDIVQQLGLDSAQDIRIVQPPSPVANPRRTRASSHLKVVKTEP